MRSAVRFACFNSPRDSIPARLAAPSPLDAHPFWGPGRGSHVSSVLEAQREVGFANASVQILQSNRGEPSITSPNRRAIWSVALGRPDHGRPIARIAPVVQATECTAALDYPAALQPWCWIQDQHSVGPGESRIRAAGRQMISEDQIDAGSATCYAFPLASDSRAKWPMSLTNRPSSQPGQNWTHLFVRLALC